MFMEYFTSLIENSPWLALALAFVLGAVVGSFLNVVVHRLPRGMNLLYPASRCPNCNHAIRWFDNVPILGWLWLRGRCRDCAAPISPRYPLVELLVGAMFATFYWIDVVIPVRLAIDASLLTGVAHRPAEQFLARFLYHSLLLCPLLAAALVDADGHAVPRRLITWPIAAGILLAFGMPAVQAVSLNFSNHSNSDLASLWALATSILGLIAAVTIRLGMFRLIGYQRPREIGLMSATLALYAVGAFLGWQAAVAIGLAAIVWTLISHPPALQNSLGRLRPASIVFIATLVWCCCERSFAACP